MALAGKNAAAFRRVSEKLARLAVIFPPKVAQNLHRGACFVALRTLVLTTPRDTGRAASGWHVTIGTPGSFVPAAPDPSADATIARGTAAISALPPFSFCWISNNVPYVGVLENGLFVPPDPGPSKASGYRKGSTAYMERKGEILVSGGYSRQAPQGMTIHALTAVEAQFDRLAQAAIGDALGDAQ